MKSNDCLETSTNFYCITYKFIKQSFDFIFKPVE